MTALRGHCPCAAHTDDALCQHEQAAAARSHKSSYAEPGYRSSTLKSTWLRTQPPPNRCRSFGLLLRIIWLRIDWLQVVWNLHPLWRSTDEESGRIMLGGLR